jgi:hypothetical protein
MKQTLELGGSIIIDRCNFDASQRGHWISIAKESADRKISVFGLVLPNYDDVEFCSVRAFQRGDDGIHEAGTDWRKVCNRMKKDFQLPTLDEGFQGIYYSTSEDDTTAIIQVLSAIP